MDVRVGLKESWVPKNWTVVLEKTLESPFDCKEIQPVNPKGDQSWIFIGRTDAEAETPILWPPDAKNWLIRKDPNAGKDWRQEEKGMREDEMAGWHHWLNGHDSEQTPWVGDGQGRLASCSPWGCKESDMTEQLDWLMGTLSLTKEARMYNSEKTVVLGNWTATYKGMKLEHFLIPFTKIHSKWIKNCKPRKHRQYIFWHKSQQDSDPLPRLMEINRKINKWDLIKIKSFCTAKETVWTRWKDKAQNGRK